VKVDLALVGGGLANSLLAYRLRQKRPEVELVLIERGSGLATGHTWSFHDGDLEPGQRAWLRPLVTHSWSSHELRFPGLHRVVRSGYNSVSSTRLHRVVSAALGSSILLGADAVELTPESVRLADGTEIAAAGVIDGRGDPGGGHLEVGFQKFVGRFVRVEDTHGLDGPILMDATVEQRDGYRFVYTLPFSERDLLIEDTYYSGGSDLDPETIRARIDEYAERRGWGILEVVGEERGVLPIVLDGDIDAFWDQGPPGVARNGMRAALFHPTTGYSLPEAVRTADAIAARWPLAGRALYEWTRQRSRRLWRRHAYFRMLNRMLFRAAEPERRYLIFERFYGLPEDLIRRFYAGRLRWTDKVRLVTGKPPVPVRRALRVLAPARRASRTTPRGGANTEELS
jgi:lycopene beta-cyclase